MGKEEVPKLESLSTAVSWQAASEQQKPQQWLYFWSLRSLLCSAGGDEHAECHLVKEQQQGGLKHKEEAQQPQALEEAAESPTRPMQDPAS